MKFLQLFIILFFAVSFSFSQKNTNNEKLIQDKNVSTHVKLLFKTFNLKYFLFRSGLKNGTD